MSEETPISIALELLRKDGLIVLALAALMWQVWFTNNDAMADRAATRAQLNDYALLARESLEQRKQMALDYQKQISDVAEAVRTVEARCKK